MQRYGQWRNSLLQCFQADSLSLAPLCPVLTYLVISDCLSEILLKIGSAFAARNVLIETAPAKMGLQYLKKFEQPKIHREIAFGPSVVYSIVRFCLWLPSSNRFLALKKVVKIMLVSFACSCLCNDFVDKKTNTNIYIFFYNSEFNSRGLSTNRFQDYGKEKGW